MPLKSRIRSLPRSLSRFFSSPQVAAWKSRCKVPLSIESTSTFVEIDLHDNYSRSENEKRMMYSMALNRMINGLVSPFQKSMYAVPIGQIAAKIGLPPALVDWRHQASHNTMPSLQELREACRMCLEWLDFNYWRKQNDFKEQAQRNIFLTMDQYKELQKHLTSSSTGSDEEEFTLEEDTTDGEASVSPVTTPNKKTKTARDKVKGQRKKIITDLLSQLTANQVSLTLIPLLVDGQHLVPKKKRKLRKYKVLPTRLKKMWSFFLKRLASAYSHFVPSLLCVIADRVFKIEDNGMSEHVRAYHRSILLCWFQYLISRFYTASSNMTSTHPQQQQSSSSSSNNNTTEDDLSGIEVMPLPTKTIITICLRHANRHSLKLVRMIQPVVAALDDPKEVARLETIRKYLAQLALVQKFDGDVEHADNFHPFNQETPSALTSSTSTSSSKWEPVRDVSPGIGILANGQLPQLDAMPLALDDFMLARFLVSPADAHRFPQLAPVQIDAAAVQAALAKSHETTSNDMDIDIQKDKFVLSIENDDEEPEKAPEPVSKRQKLVEPAQRDRTPQQVPAEKEVEKPPQAKPAVQLFVSLDDFIN